VIDVLEDAALALAEMITVAMIIHLPGVLSTTSATIDWPKYEPPAGTVIGRP
jgi:hypothetical protein